MSDLLVDNTSNIIPLVRGVTTNFFKLQALGRQKDLFSQQGLRVFWLARQGQVRKNGGKLAGEAGHDSVLPSDYIPYCKDGPSKDQ